MQIQYNIQELVINDQEIIDKDLRCPICLHIVVDPKECSKCQSDFCNKCIQQLQSCPNKCNKAQFQNCHKRTRGILENLNLKCPNYEIGCNTKIRMNQINTHIQVECQFQQYQCRNKGCVEIIYDFIKEMHNNSCKYKILKCKQCQLPYKQFNQHDCLKDASKSIKNKNRVLKLQLRKINKLQGKVLKLEEKVENLEAINLNYNKCNRNHQLKWQMGSKGHCSQCKNINKGFQSCQLCFEIYCIYCRPPQIKKDECQNGHQLLPYENNENKSFLCHICKNEGNQMHHDWTCGFTICKRCFDINQ